MEFWRLLMHMIGIWCIGGMFFWLFDGIPKKFNWKFRWLLIAALTLAAVYLAEMAPAFMEHTIRLHAALTFIGTLCFGPIVGTVTGILVGVEQLLAHHYLAYPAEVFMPLIAALIGSFIWLLDKARPKCRFVNHGLLKPGWGFGVTFFVEALYMVLIYLFYPGDKADALAIVWVEALPTMVCGAVLAFVCLYVHNDRRFFPVRLDELIYD